MNPDSLSRRGFLAMAAASSVALRAQNRKHVPVGLLIYAVLADWKKDFDGTLTAVAKMGYQGLEITQYESWTPERTKEVRKLLDSLKLKVFSTHTEPPYLLTGDRMKHMLELNHILGTETICCVRGLANIATLAENDPPNANAGFGGRRGGKKNSEPPPTKGGKKGGNGGGPESGFFPQKATNEADAWKEFGDALQVAASAIKKEKMVLGFHNHAVEFQNRLNGVGRPIDILAKAAPDLQFGTDVNVATRAGTDLVAFMKQYPGRTDHLLLTDGPPDAEGHVPALGKGDIPWNEIFNVAEGPRGVKFYLLTHGRADVPPMEAVKRDFEQYEVVHGV
jgi:sugar phosphate isomerase/epimerase